MTPTTDWIDAEELAKFFVWFEKHTGMDATNFNTSIFFTYFKMGKTICVKNVNGQRIATVLKSVC
jgi:hypothetical protein